MIKKLKTLLTLGVITVVTAGSALPVSALTIQTNTKSDSRGSVYLCINGKKYKFNINSNCNNKPDNNTGSDNNTETNKPDNNTESNNNTETNKPDNNTESNNNTGTNKPDNNTESNNNTGTNKPDNNTESNNNIGTNKPDNNTESNNQDSTNSFVAYQQEVVSLVNKERAKYGLSPLKSNASLANVATVKSQDMINKNYFSHTSPTYGSPFDMMKKFGISYSAAGENIAMGQRTRDCEVFSVNSFL